MKPPYPIKPQPPEGIIAAGGWCAPSEWLYDYFPDVAITRGGVRYDQPSEPPPPLTIEEQRARRRTQRRARRYDRRVHRVLWLARVLNVSRIDLEPEYRDD